MMRGQRFILLIGDKGVCLTAKHAAPLYADHRDSAAVQSIRQTLAAQPQAPVTLLVDSGAQDYRLETLPRLSALDRRQLIRRRLRQAFPDDALVASQNRKSTVMLAGLHRDSTLMQWSDFLRHCKTDICLLPVEGLELLLHLRPAAREGWHLLLAPMRTGGFRQIVSRDGQLVFTRLTPPPTGRVTPKIMAAALAGDIRASLGYLARLGLVDSSDLSALLLVPADWHAACGEIELPLHTLEWLSPESVAAQLSLPPPIEVDDVFAAHLLARGKPTLRLAPAASLSALNALAAHGWAERLVWGAFALGALATLWPATQLVDALWQNHSNAQRLEASRQSLAQQQQAAAPITEPLGRLRMALERQKLFSGDALDWAALQALGQGLGADIKLVRLEWTVPSGNAKAEEWQLAAQWRSTENPAPEKVVARFRRLAQDLAQALPGYGVDLTHLPYPALPQEIVSNKSDTAQEPDDTALLTLRRLP